MQSNILVCYDNENEITDCTNILTGYIDTTKYSNHNRGYSRHSLQKVISIEIKTVQSTRIDAVYHVQVASV